MDQTSSTDPSTSDQTITSVTSILSDQTLPMDPLAMLASPLIRHASSSQMRKAANILTIITVDTLNPKNCNNNRVVKCKENVSSDNTSFCLYNDISDPTNILPSIVMPEQLSVDRQWYLFDNIRSLVPERARDIVCPKPLGAHHTFAQTRAEKSKPTLRKRKSPSIDSEDITIPNRKSSIDTVIHTVSTAKRIKQTCSYCGLIGHTN